MGGASFISLLTSFMSRDLFRRIQNIIMRGFWYMLEAVIAGIIIIGFLAVMSQSYMSPTQDYTIKAYSVLKGLDEQGVLRPYAEAGDWGGLDSEVRIYGRNHSIQLCTASECVGRLPEGQEADGRRQESPSVHNVWVGNYIIAGGQDFSPVQVKLYVW
jgi:hypothetical protein